MVLSKGHNISNKQDISTWSNQVKILQIFIVFCHFKVITHFVFL